MNNRKLELIQLIESGNDLLNRSKHCLANAQIEKIETLAQSVPPKILPPDKNVRVVFAGQYSAGKSSIVKVLTGREDIAIGGDITTQRAEVIDWGDKTKAMGHGAITIVDTPGIHTELRPDHDEITYKEIAEADLLLFVVTNELFDSHLANHFRKLAVERDKGHEMMLVVNKMGRCAQGNSKDQQEVILEDLKKVINPLTHENLRTTFLDAKSALESVTETDGEISKILFNKSGKEEFVDNLNSFVRDKGLLSKYTTQLYQLEQILQEAISSNTNGDHNVKGLEELLLQRRRALLDTKNRIPQAVEREIQDVSLQIRQEGRNIADMVNASADNKLVGEELKSAQNRVELLTEQLENSVQEIIQDDMNHLEERIGDIANSEFAQQLLPKLRGLVEQADLSPEARDKLKNASEISSRLGQFLINNSFTSQGTLNGLLKLKNYAGTSAHEAVKAVGKMLGKSFKPWEAVKWARTLANVGRGLMVVGTVLTIALQFKEDADADKLELELKKYRTALRSGFNDAANAIELHFDKATQTFISENITSEIDEIDEQLDELRSLEQTRSNLFENLLGLLEETRILIKNVHTSTEVL